MPICWAGSIRSIESRRRTLPEAGEGLPLAVEGYQRYWGLNGPKMGVGATFLLVSPLQGALMNAVVFCLPDAAAIQSYDTRERGYCRSLLSQASIRLLTGTLPELYPSQVEIE